MKGYPLGIHLCTTVFVAVWEIEPRPRRARQVPLSPFLGDSSQDSITMLHLQPLYSLLVLTLALTK